MTVGCRELGEGDKLNGGWGEFDNEIDVEEACDLRSSFNLKYNNDGSAGEDIYDSGHEDEHVGQRRHGYSQMQREHAVHGWVAIHLTHVRRPVSRVSLQ